MRQAYSDKILPQTTTTATRRDELPVWAAAMFPGGYADIFASLFAVCCSLFAVSPCAYLSHGDSLHPSICLQTGAPVRNGRAVGESWNTVWLCTRQDTAGASSPSFCYLCLIFSILYFVFVFHLSACFSNKIAACCDSKGPVSWLSIGIATSYAPTRRVIVFLSSASLLSAPG